MIIYNGLIWFHGDSGAQPELYGFDTIQNKTVKTIRINNAQNHDWEDITQDENYIYIGDFGNNNGERRNLSILKIKKSETNQSSQAAEIIQFSFDDQLDFSKRNRAHNYDCEALVSVDGDLYIFTKDWNDLQSRVYKIPNAEGFHQVKPLKSWNSEGLITGAAYESKSNVLALSGYKKEGLTLIPFLLIFENVTSQNITETTNFQKYFLHRDFHQVEAICDNGTGSFLFSNESIQKKYISISAKLMEFRMIDLRK